MTPDFSGPQRKFPERPDERRSGPFDVAGFGNEYIAPTAPIVKPNGQTAKLDRADPETEK
jgi:hypothetical protein